MTDHDMSTSHKQYVSRGLCRPTNVTPTYFKAHLQRNIQICYGSIYSSI